MSPTQRLLEQIRQDGVGRDLRVEVMEQSGLRGNEVRDFNLLMEPVRRAAAHLSQEELEGRLRAVLGMEHLQDTDVHADACTVSVLLLMNAALLHARLEDAQGQAADLARVGRLHEVATGAEPVKVLSEAWTAVLRYDYEPVFRPALDVLEALAAADAQGGVNQAVRAVAAWAHENAEVYVSMGMEYAGELFSRGTGQPSVRRRVLHAAAGGAATGRIGARCDGRDRVGGARDVAAAQDGRLGLRERHAVERVPGGGQGSDPQILAATNGAQPSSTNTPSSGS